MDQKTKVEACVHTNKEKLEYPQPATTHDHQNQTNMAWGMARTKTRLTMLQQQGQQRMNTKEWALKAKNNHGRPTARS